VISPAASSRPAAPSSAKPASTISPAVAGAASVPAGTAGSGSAPAEVTRWPPGRQPAGHQQSPSSISTASSPTTRPAVNIRCGAKLNTIVPELPAGTR